MAIRARAMTSVHWVPASMLAFWMNVGKSMASGLVRLAALIGEKRLPDFGDRRKEGDILVHRLAADLVPHAAAIELDPGPPAGDARSEPDPGQRRAHRRQIVMTHAAAEQFSGHGPVERTGVHMEKMEAFAERVRGCRLACSGAAIDGHNDEIGCVHDPRCVFFQTSSRTSKKSGNVFAQQPGLRIHSQGRPSPRRSWQPRMAKLIANR